MKNSHLTNAAVHCRRKLNEYLNKTCISLSLVLSLILVSALVSSAQKPTPTPERNREIVALINDASLAAPELGVDTLLKIVESKKIKDSVWKREILDEAMRMADEVKYPVRRKRAFWETFIVDTVSGYMTYAYDQKLDTLSFKARILKSWIGEDKIRARQIAFQIGGDLRLKPVRCDDAMSYMVEDVYESLGAVSRDVFSPKEISDGVRGLFILPWIENIESPTQIVPVMEMLASLRSPLVERQLLNNAFERAINRKFADDRSFGYSLLGNPLRGKFVRELDDPASFLSAWRDFLKKNMAGPRCLDSKPEKGKVPWFIAEYNYLAPEAKRFSEEDFDEVEYTGIPTDKLYIDSVMYKKVSLLFKTAREKKNLPENKDDKAAQLEWQLKVSDVLEFLDSWKATADEPEREVFNQKALWYRALIGEIKEPEIRLVAARAYMRYLAGSPMQKESFIEWFYHARWGVEKYPDLFKELAEEFPNPNFKVMVSARKALTADREKSPAVELPK